MSEPPPSPPETTSDLPSTSVRRPILVVVMNLLIVIAGLMALMGVEVRELPNVENPIVTVRADYPGAAPETMDAEVTRALEGAAARVSGVDSISSASEEGNARVRLYFSPDVDINNAANDVREAVSEVERSLPDGVENVVVVKANDEADPIMRLSISSASLNEEDLTRVVEDQVVPGVLGVPGVADAQVYGDRERTLKIVIDPLRLASHRLSIDAVAGALENANLDVPAGSFDSADQDLIVRADASVVTEDKVGRIVIRGQTRLEDVADVFYAPEEATSFVRLDGRRVIGLGVIRQARSNTIEISEGVDRVVASLNRQLRDVRVVKTSDEAVFIRGAVSEVFLTLMLATVIVIMVIMLFMGSPRLMLVPAVTIPVALIGTLSAIWLLGFSINILTLLALLLATGLVVDDAIVVLENIERTRRMGMGRLAAAVLGTRQVFFAVIATTLTLASVFVPIAFLPGRAGQLFVEFGFVLAISVALSSFVALTLCPMIASRLIRRDAGAERPGALRRPLVAAGSRIASFYGTTLARVLNAPILACALGLALTVLVALLYQSLDRELVPEEDRGLIIVSLQGPDGANLEYADRQAKKVEAIMQPLVESGEATGLLSLIGRYDPNRAFIVAPLAPWGERRSQQEIADSLRPQLESIPGARASFRSPNSLSIRTGGADLEFALTGPDYSQIALAADAFLTALRERAPGIREPEMEYNTTQPQLLVEIDRERASDLGVDIDGIAATLRAMVEGDEVTELSVDDQSIPIVLESRAGAVNDTDDLRNLYVATDAGRVVPLSSLIRIVESGTAAELEREGQRRAIEVEAKLASGYPLNEAVADLEATAAATLPPGINLLLLGQAEALQETGRDVLITFGVALLVVLLVLAAQFESFASAAVVMVTVPFGIAAAIFSLWATGTSLNVYSQIGLVMLIGLMAKNGILIVEFANQLRDQGKSVRDAVLEAAVVRLRPVVMTMISTTAAAVPLIVSGGPGAEARESIGWTIVGGLGISIVAVLYVTPAAYALLAPLARSRGDFGRALEDEMAEAAGHGRLSGRPAPEDSGPGLSTRPTSSTAGSA